MLFQFFINAASYLVALVYETSLILLNKITQLSFVQTELFVTVLAVNSRICILGKALRVTAQGYLQKIRRRRDIPNSDQV